MLADSNRYRKQREIFSLKRQMYAELSTLYRGMREDYRALRTLHWDLWRFYQVEADSSANDREAAQRQRQFLLSDITQLKLEIENLQAAIVNLQRTNATWIDIP